MALVVLVALLVAGVAHASRLCRIDGHAAPAADAVRCPAHPAADVAPASAGAHRSPAIPPPPHERPPSCCTGGTSLAALPGARTELARDVAVQTLATLAVAPLLSNAALRITPVVHAAPDPGSGPRRHLVHRILLI